MERFLQRHASRILGSMSGFDRVLFRGVLRSISYVQGLDWFMGNQRVGFKDFEWFVQKFSAGIKKRAEEIAQRAGRPWAPWQLCCLRPRPEKTCAATSPTV
jgi:hypothetical protein